MLLYIWSCIVFGSIRPYELPHWAELIGICGGAVIRGHNPPQNWVLQHFEEVLSLNIGNAEQDTVGP